MADLLTCEELIGIFERAIEILNHYERRTNPDPRKGRGLTPMCALALTAVPEYEVHSLAEWASKRGRPGYLPPSKASEEYSTREAAVRQSLNKLLGKESTVQNRDNILEDLLERLRSQQPS